MSENNKYPGLLGPVPSPAELSQAAHNEQQTLFGKMLRIIESQQAEIDRLRQENERLYFLDALRNYRSRPKKRGPKPKPKPEVDNTPKKLGRSQKFTDKTHELMIELVDTLKEQNGFKTDKEALMYFLEDLCVESGRFKSRHEARKQFGSLQIQLSKARNKKG